MSLDIELLAQRLVGVTDWLRQHAQGRAMPIGYFGTARRSRRPDGSGAAAGGGGGDRLRGGRPGIAGEGLSRGRAPTLLIVGSRDEPVIEMNQWAAARLRCDHRLVIGRGQRTCSKTGHARKGPQLAADWFDEYC